MQIICFLVQKVPKQPKKSLKEISFFGSFWVILDQQKHPLRGAGELVNNYPQLKTIICFLVQKVPKLPKKIKKKIIFGTFWVILDEKKIRGNANYLFVLVQKVPKQPKKRTK